MSTAGFKLVELDGEPGSKLGIAHIPVVLDAFGANLRHIRKVVFYASEIGVETLILPYSSAFGQVIEVYSNRMEPGELRRRYAIDAEHPYIKALRYLSTSYGVSIASPGVIERIRGWYYISTIFVHKDSGTLISQRKIVVSSEEKRVGVRPGREIVVFDDGRLKYLVLLSNEILAPEIGRLGVIEGGNILITVLPPLKPLEDYTTILKAIARMLGVWVVNVGGLYLIESNLHALNSMVIDPGGRTVLLHQDSTPGLITISFKKIRQLLEADEREFNATDVLKLVLKHYRRTRGKSSF
ncbi:MAG: carbon-nitrogen hydrolase family protein [Desulfurococcus sp.]|nr:carbon-nitrogen hydrolase family protein [Desulfurococcus sp.]